MTRPEDSPLAVPAAFAMFAMFAKFANFESCNIHQVDQVGGLRPVQVFE